MLRVGLAKHEVTRMKRERARARAMEMYLKEWHTTEYER
jgi:hypothetical protein